MNFHVDDLVEVKVPESTALQIYIKIQDLKLRQSQMGILHGYTPESSSVISVVQEPTTSGTNH